MRSNFTFKYVMQTVEVHGSVAVVKVTRAQGKEGKQKKEDPN
jgi:hypothetical protein